MSDYSALLLAVVVLFVLGLVALSKCRRLSASRAETKRRLEVEARDGFEVLRLAMASLVVRPASMT